jgi:hypothetical protein
VLVDSFAALFSNLHYVGGHVEYIPGAGEILLNIQQILGQPSSSVFRAVALAFL